MNNRITNYCQTIRLGCKLIMVVALMFVNQIFAQQKFTIQLGNGIYQQIPVNGLKLTFDNNGSFSYWRNGLKQDLNFNSIGKIYFTNLSLSTKTDENIHMSDALKVYPNPSDGIIKIERLPIYQKNKISIYTIDGKLLKKRVTYSTSETIDISDLIAGAYLLSINNETYMILKE